MRVRHPTFLKSNRMCVFYFNLSAELLHINSAICEAMSSWLTITEFCGKSEIFKGLAYNMNTWKGWTETIRDGLLFILYRESSVPRVDIKQRNDESNYVEKLSHTDLAQSAGENKSVEYYISKENPDSQLSMCMCRCKVT